MKRLKSKKSKKGFTIIELMLAMGFLGVMLVCIAMLTIEVTNIYQKGLSIRAVNSLGRQLIDDFSRTVGASPIMEINPVPSSSGVIDDQAVKNAQKKYFFSFESNSNEDNNSGSVQQRGAFCTGLYTYVWNTAGSYSPNESKPTAMKITYKDATNNGNRVDNYSNFKLVRFSDPNRLACTKLDQGGANSSRIDMTEAGNIEPIELISSDESDLALYDLTIFPATQNTITGQTFYSATFILATIRGGINILDNGNYCGNENGGANLDYSHYTDFSYCAINKFNFAMRATGYTDAGSNEGKYGNR